MRRIRALALLLALGCAFLGGASAPVSPSGTAGHDAAAAGDVTAAVAFSAARQGRRW